MRSNCLGIFLILFLVNYVFSFECRALSLGSSGDRGFYEAGILDALSKYEKVENIKWRVVSGVSAGALNSAIIASYEIGHETRAIERIKTLALTLKQSDIYKGWFGGLVNGFFFKSGLYDSSPLFQIIQRMVNTTVIRNSNRVFITGAHSVSKSNFVTWNNTSPNLLKGIYASGSLLGFFPTVKIGDDHYTDGGVSYTSPITSAIRACKKLGATKVYVDSVVPVSDSHVPESMVGKTTPYILAKTLFHILSSFFQKDIENARHSFPDAIIREFKPLKPLPGNPIGYENAQELFQLGYQDGKRIILKQDYFL
jgi:NTE family protein